MKTFRRGRRGLRNREKLTLNLIDYNSHIFQEKFARKEFKINDRISAHLSK